MFTIEQIFVWLLLAILVLFFFVWWRYPKQRNRAKWFFLISISMLAFIMPIVDRPNGFFLGCLFAPATFILGYLRLFAREKAAMALFEGIQSMLPEEQRKKSKDILHKRGVSFPDDMDDSNREN
jgi:hypothetical protein